MDASTLRSQACRSLAAAAYPPRRVVLVYQLLCAGLSLGAALVAQLLQDTMSGSDGLGGLDTQAVIVTAMVVAQLLPVVAEPFLTAGLRRWATDTARGRGADLSALSQGLRRFGPVLSSTLFMGLQYVAIAFLSIYLGETLFLLTPMADPLHEAVAQGQSLTTLSLPVLAGLLLTCGAVMLVLFLPVYYRNRLSAYLVMDDLGLGGIRAVSTSRLLMLRRRVALFKLDLAMWWVHLLRTAAKLLINGPALLALLGTDLSLGATWAWWIGATGLYVALSVALQPRLELYYAHWYDAVFREGPVVPLSQPGPFPQTPQDPPAPWQGQ